MLLKYYGFRDDPFGSTPDPRWLYPSPTHREALASLKYGFFSNRGFTALIAPPGTGKTTLLFRFLDDIRESADTVLLFDIDGRCESKELMGRILWDLGIDPGQTGNEMHDQLSGVVIGATKAGRKLVVIIDEAQNLSDSALEMVRLLTNFETPRAKLMQIVLAGQPQLSDKLMLPSLVQLRQRISTVCRLRPLSPRETVEYMEHRLRLAGYCGDRLFTGGALDLITEASHGIPRTINNLCFNSMSLCCALKRKQVDRSMVAEVIADHQLISLSEEPSTIRPEATSVRLRKCEPGRSLGVVTMKPLWSLVAVLVIASTLGALGRSELWTGRIHKRANGSLQSKAVASPATAAGPAIITSPDVPPIEITVEPHQTVQQIVMSHFGDFDLQRQRQIMALNPTLANLDHVEAGQRLRLPGPEIESATRHQHTAK